MSLQGLLVAPFTVAGRINCGEYHKAKAIAEGCSASASATCTPLLPTDYDKLLVTLQEQHGGPAYLHKSGVVVYSATSGFIGDEVKLLTWLKRNGIADADAGLHADGHKENFDVVAETAYMDLLCESGLTFAFLELTFDGNVIGRLVFELFPNLAPKTCENFLALCAGTEGGLGYVGTPIHRVKPGGWMQGGDVKTGNGDVGASASGTPLADESFAIDHTELGVLGMVNVGPHTAASQFYVTFGACPIFDKKFVAFGKLVDGTKLLRFIENLDLNNERPRAALEISDAGIVSKKEVIAGVMDEDEAAAKLQAITKGRAQRKEAKERKEAAKRVQAAKRGQQARKERKEQEEAAVKMQAINRGRAERKKRKA